MKAIDAILKKCEECGIKKTLSSFQGATRKYKMCQLCRCKPINNNTNPNIMIKRSENANERIKAGVLKLQSILETWTEIKGIELQEKTDLTFNELSSLTKMGVLQRRKIDGARCECILKKDIEINESFINNVKSKYVSSSDNKTSEERLLSSMDDQAATKKTLCNITIPTNKFIVFTESEKIILIKMAKKEGQTSILEKVIDSL